TVVCLGVLGALGCLGVFCAFVFFTFVVFAFASFACLPLPVALALAVLSDGAAGRVSAWAREGAGDRLESNATAASTAARRRRFATNWFTRDSFRHDVCPVGAPGGTGNERAPHGRRGSRPAWARGQAAQANRAVRAAATPEPAPAVVPSGSEAPLPPRLGVCWPGSPRRRVTPTRSRQEIAMPLAAS